MANKIHATLIKKAANSQPGSAPRWKPKRKGDAIAGEVISIEERTGEDDVFQICFLKNQAGEVISFALGTVLRRLFEANEVSQGDMIAIVYQGEAPAKRKGYSGAKLYSMAIDGREVVYSQQPRKVAKRKGRK